MEPKCNFQSVSLPSYVKSKLSIPIFENIRKYCMIMVMTIILISTYLDYNETNNYQIVWMNPFEIFFCSFFSFVVNWSGQMT